MLFNYITLYTKQDILTKILSEGIKDLINEYFKVDVLECIPMTEDTRQNIIATFTYCYNNHMSVKSVAKQLQHSNLSELRDRIIKRMGSNYNPFPVRLGSLKPDLQKEACAKRISLHRHVWLLLRDRVNQ